MKYIEHDDVVHVPKGAGARYFLDVVENLLKKVPRISSILINAVGEVRYSWYAPEDAPKPSLGLQLETITPYSIIRNSKVMELEYAMGLPAPYNVATMFVELTRDELYPLAFVVGSEERLRAWHHEPRMDGEMFYGVPLIISADLPKEVIILCGGMAPGGALTDTYKCYKMVMEVGDG